MEQEQRRCALVTGASRGIGRGVALTLAKQGYDIFFSHFSDEEEAQRTSASIGQLGVRSFVMEGDLRDAAHVEELARRAVKELGRVDVLVNNAGVTLLGEIVSMPMEDMETLIHLNFRAPLLLTRCVGAHMIEQGIHGNIVNIASTHSLRAYPRDALYGGLKAGLARAVESLALEFAPHHIRVNAISPGAIRVREGHQEFVDALGRKIPLGRMGTPEDIGQAVAWLVSDAASYVTGINLKVDGGLILPGMPEDVRPEAGYGWGVVHPPRRT